MFFLTVWQNLKCCRINNKWSISLVFRLLFSGFFQFVSAKQSLTHYLADLAHRSGLTLISTAGDFHSVDCYNQCLSWGNSIPSTVTRPQPSLPPPLHPISPAPGQASSNLPTHCTEIWGAQLSFSLSFLIHSFSLILVSTAVFICLLYSVSHLLFSSHFLLSVSDAVFLSFSNTLYIFLSVCFSLALILCLPYYLLAPYSLWCHLFLAHPLCLAISVSSLHLSPSLFIRLHLLLLPACFIFPPPPPRCPVAASVGGMLKSAATLSWMKSNMTGSTTVAGRQMYFLEFTSRVDTLSFPLALVWRLERFYSL